MTLPNLEQPILNLIVLPGVYTICRLPADTPVPEWAMQGDFHSVTRTQDELSIVCAQEHVPGAVKHEAGWACLQVQGLSISGSPGFWLH